MRRKFPFKMYLEMGEGNKLVEEMVLTLKELIWTDGRRGGVR